MKQILPIKYDVHIDESKYIISRFIEQCVKDVLNQSFRFSPLQSEREYYETARDFLYGHTAIDWGGKYYNIIDFIGLMKIDYNYFRDFIEKEEKIKEKDYLKKISTKKGNEIRALFISASTTPYLWKRSLMYKLQDINIKYYEHKQMPDDEILEDINEQFGENEYRNAIRKTFDQNTGLIDNSDLVIVKWKSGEKQSNIIHELSHAYSRFIPIYTITLTSVMKIPKNLFAYTNNIFPSVEKLIEYLERKTGKKNKSKNIDNK